jgi:hypothetical protein
MTGCTECGAPTPNRKCRACRLAERATEAAADQDAGVYDCPTCDGLSSSENVPCYKCRSEGQKIATDGGERDGEWYETEWTLTCLDCDFSDELTRKGHPRDGPHEDVEKRVTRHKHTTDESHVVRVEGRRADRDDEIDPSLLTDGGLNAESLSESDVDGLELAADRVPEICEELALSEKVTDRACELARRADLEHVEVNRSPAAVAAGAVYLAACLKNEKRTQRRVGAVAEVSEVTIRDTYHEIAKVEGYEIEPSRGRAPRTEGWRSKFESALNRIRPTVGGDDDV